MASMPTSMFPKLRLIRKATGLLVAFALCRACCAADAVYLVPAAGAQARPKLTGRIVDYNGRELLIDISGVEKRYPAEQVAEVETELTPTHLAADELFARREYAAAVPKYEQAMRGESRRWVQRRIVAQMIWGLRNMGQYRRAGELFLALARDDPAMLYDACIPLAWVPAQPAPDLEKKSQEWLKSDAAWAVLIGASHLLSTGERSEAVKRLERLSDDKDPRIASLARALVWNATYVSATPAQLAAWSDEIETFPPSVRAGPYFVLGRALAQHKQFEDAALNLLRVQMLYPQDRLLATAASYEAGRSLEGAGTADAAVRIYRELIASDPQSRPATEAQGRLKALEANRTTDKAGG